MTTRDARRLATHGGACYSCSCYREDRLSRCWICRCSHHVIRERHDQYGMLLYLCLAYFGTNSTWTFASLVGLGSEQVCKIHRMLSFERVSCANEHGLSSCHEVSCSIVSYVQVVALCEESGSALWFHAVFLYNEHGTVPFALPISSHGAFFYTHEYVLCEILRIVSFSLLSLLDVSLYIVSLFPVYERHSLDNAVSSVQASALYCLGSTEHDIHANALYEFQHIVLIFLFPALNETLDKPYVFRLSLLYDFDNAAFCTLLYKFCRESEDRLYGSCFCENAQEWKGAIAGLLDTWGIASLKHEEIHSWDKPPFVYALLFLLPGWQGYHLFARVNYSLARQLIHYLTNTAILQACKTCRKGIIWLHILKRVPSRQMPHPVNLMPLSGSRTLLDRITCYIGGTPAMDNTEGTRKGRRNEHTQDRKVRCALICMNNQNKKMQSCAEMMQPTHRVSNKMIDAGFLNNVENCLVAAGAIYFLATPYHLYTNPTLNSGSTRTDTVTGVGGIPSSGVLGILIGVGLFSNTSGGGYVQIYPTGGTAGQYASFSAPNAGQYTTGFVIVPVSTGGQITVKANAQNCVLQDWYIFGYIQ